MVTMDGTQTDTVPWEEGKESMSGGMIREVRRQELSQGEMYDGVEI